MKQYLNLPILGCLAALLLIGLTFQNCAPYKSVESSTSLSSNESSFIPFSESSYDNTTVTPDTLVLLPSSEVNYNQPVGPQQMLIVFSQSPERITTAKDAIFNFLIVDEKAVSGVRCALDDRPYQVCLPDLNLTWNDLTPGSHNIHFEVQLDTGDILNQSFAWEILPVVDGGWSAWVTGNWSDNANKCGTRTKTRSCNSPAPRNGGQNCSGPSSESETKACIQWVNATSSQSPQSVCAPLGLYPKACASSEAKQSKMAKYVVVNRSTHMCYAAGQKRDNDSTDRVNAYLCGPGNSDLVNITTLSTGGYDHANDR